MLNLKQSMRIYRLTLRKNLICLRTLIILILESIICLIVVLPVVQAASMLNIKVNLLEIVLSMNSNPLYFMLILACSLLLIADVPFFDTNESMILYRSNRKSWFIGKILYIVTITFINVIFIFLLLRIAMSKVLYIDNYFSSYFTSNSSRDLPVVQFLSLPPKILEEATPYYGAISAAILTILYMIFQSLMLFILNLKFKRKEGILITLSFCLIGYVLLGVTPKISKFSPFNNTLLQYHSLKYQTSMPTIAQSYVYFGIVISILILVLYYLIQVYSFKVRE